ncbi:MAG: L-seryl-tRNA(Sec) selenium transferase [Eubacteriales bacterium]|nr:L-seryl-tRNA(Sec) selenium transferase [Eubacteriales bacterium]MDD4389908.1 L-seryl-tRNA(Sec) selenium transferase [Eubacteriales bacterium]
MEKGKLLREIPKIDEVLNDRRLFVFFGDTPRNIILEAAREEVDKIRDKIMSADSEQDLNKIQMGYDSILTRIINRIEEKKQKNLRRTINATGIILHTNLGRAKLSRGACDAVAEVAANYSTLEYDLKRGVRGSRHDHIEKLIMKITGADAAMVVNNNAAATMLCLSALAKDREVIVSRGELVEIGGSFRIPEIMEQSGAVLREVGTTNKTKPEDYSKAINECTAALLKVNTSNYKIVGFTAEVCVSELVKIAAEKELPVIYDMGSGLMSDMKKYGVDEPTVADGISQGADIMLFSGDKLLGGPQSGIIIGKKKYINVMKKHPLARVLRVDKMTIAALEATFRAYLEPEYALKNLPLLAMMTIENEELKNRAEAIKERISSTADIFEAEITEVEDRIGGGAAPTSILSGWGVSVSSDKIGTKKIESALRAYKIPIIARIYKDKVLINARTVSDEEIEFIARAFSEMQI